MSADLIMEFHIAINTTTTTTRNTDLSAYITSDFRSIIMIVAVLSINTQRAYQKSKANRETSNRSDVCNLLILVGVSSAPIPHYIPYHNFKYTLIRSLYKFIVVV